MKTLKNAQQDILALQEDVQKAIDKFLLEYPVIRLGISASTGDYLFVRFYGAIGIEGPP
ncbi:hypothetical protein LCGC14_0831840 [marine sediment metagenome]|uniref:Uncharacterized protein n=1 Tax=marine sediment metagenome TaxID=412755 RepID=A0A0F9PFQ5_9ZZZZ